jgi:hypothetical protein
MRRILFRKVHRMFRCNSLKWQTKTAHVSIAGWQTLSENIRLSSTRQSSRDGLRPFQTVSNHVQTAGNSSKPSKPPQTISILQKEPSNSILLHPVQVQFLGSHRNTFSANCKKVPRRSQLTLPHFKFWVPQILRRKLANKNGAGSYISCCFNVLL